MTINPFYYYASEKGTLVLCDNSIEAWVEGDSDGNKSVEVDYIYKNDNEDLSIEVQGSAEQDECGDVNYKGRAGIKWKF